jgi:hypothetical protein
MRYKSSLQGLVEELKGPVYVTATQQQSRARIGEQDAIPCVVFGVSAAGFNAEGRVIELQLRQPSVITLFDEDVRQASAANARVLADLKARFTGLGFEVRDGAISTEPVIGVLE